MKNSINLKRIHLILFALLLIFIQACTKDEIADNPSGSGGGGSLPISYSYTVPINIKLTADHHIGFFPYLPVEVITTNYIFSGTGLSVSRSPIGSNNYTTFTASIPPSTVEQVAGCSGFVKSGSSSTYYTSGLFTVDNNETTVYIVCKAYDPNIPQQAKNWIQIVKWNLLSGAATKILSINTNPLDFLKGVSLKCIRVTADGTLYIASMANNGSIVKVSPIGLVTIIASNLINPGFFDIYNGSLYVPINSGSGGKIIKIDPNNVITDVIQNLTGPANVAIDNYGSLLVRSQTTIGGSNYHRHDLYKMNGDFIGNVTDAYGTTILSNTYENMPFTFDSYNNLYFYHADGVVNGGITYNNPRGQKGLFKMGIIKN